MKHLKMAFAALFVVGAFSLAGCSNFCDCFGDPCGWFNNDCSTKQECAPKKCSPCDNACSPRKCAPCDNPCAPRCSPCDKPRCEPVCKPKCEPRCEQPRCEQPRCEKPRCEQPRCEQPRCEQPRCEQPCKPRCN